MVKYPSLENNNHNVRLISVDYLKAICCFLIICIHFPFPEPVGGVVKVLARTAVPIFFMISGYFYTPDKTKNQLQKVLSIAVISTVLYMCWDLAISIANGSVGNDITELFGIANILRFLLFNETLFGAHLWYLWALIYVYLFYWIAERLKIKKLLIYISLALILIDLVFGKYSLLIFGREYQTFYVRNWLFVGIPYFTIGNYIKNKQEWIQDRISLRLALLGLAVSTILCFCEKYILDIYNLNATRDHYFFTFFMSIWLFILFLHFDIKCEDKLSSIGKLHSTNIYIVHMWIISIVGWLQNRISFINRIIYIMPFIIFGGSLVISHILRMLECRQDRKRILM